MAAVQGISRVCLYRSAASPGGVMTLRLSPRFERRRWSYAEVAEQRWIFDARIALVSGKQSWECVIRLFVSAVMP